MPSHPFQLHPLSSLCPQSLLSVLSHMFLVVLAYWSAISTTIYQVVHDVRKTADLRILNETGRENVGLEAYQRVH